jgi:eukaryotic-like serine/threonine-protein kinase
MAGVGELVAGRYRIARPLGAGGMGRVWLAVDEVRHRRVAIKKCSMPDGLTGGEQELVRGWTLREARATARVCHPNVIRIEDVLPGDDHPWTVMEYVPSRSLLQLIEDAGPLPVGQVARIGLAVLDALDGARRAGVLHLDVKPSNVLIADDGRVVLTDFAPAVTDEGIDALARAGIILGSPNYIAPERLLDGVATARTDLWSLGATLYHAAEGRPPFLRKTTGATLRAVTDGAPDPPKLAGPLSGVLIGLLCRDPAERMTAAEVAGRLRRLAEVRVRPLLPVLPSRLVAPGQGNGHGPNAIGTDLVALTAGREPPSVWRRIRGGVTAMAAVFAIVAALFVVPTADRLPWANSGGRTHSSEAGPALTQLAVPSPSPFVLPPRFRWWNDPSGFRVAVPSGWPTTRQRQSSVVFTAPGGLPSLRISAWTPGNGNVVTALIGEEREARLPAYRRIRIEALPMPPDAVWEYTSRDPRAGPVRGLQRVMSNGGRTYLIEWRTPRAAWAADLPKLSVVLDSFRPLDGT